MLQYDTPFKPTSLKNCTNVLKVTKSVRMNYMRKYQVIISDITLLPGHVLLSSNHSNQM